MELDYDTAKLIHDHAWNSQDEDIIALRDEFYVAVKLMYGEEINKCKQEMEAGVADAELARFRRLAGFTPGYVARKIKLAGL